MSENEIPVALPGGGTAYVAKVQTHLQARTMRSYFLLLNRYYTREPIPGTDEERRVEKPNLTPEQVQEMVDLDSRYGEFLIRSRVLRWEGVTDPDGNALDFPDGIDRMRADDARDLYGAVQAAAERELLPNSGETSGATSSGASGRKTR